MQNDPIVEEMRKKAGKHLQPATTMTLWLFAKRSKKRSNPWGVKSSNAHLVFCRAALQASKALPPWAIYP